MSNKKKIDQLVKHLENEEKVYIQTHNFPDPDAIASAFGLQYLLEKYGISSEIIYDGQLQSNPVERMISELGISIYHYSEVKMMQNSKIVIVDGCKGNKNVTDLMGIKAAIIDHHQSICSEAAAYCDIRPDYGACSTIVSLYAKEAAIILSKNVATALALGIHVDTNSFRRGVSFEDLEAFIFLFDKIEHTVLGSILRNNIIQEELELYRKALNDVVLYKEFAFYCFKDFCSQNLLGILADFFLSIEEIDFVVLCSKIKDRIIMSVRSERLEWNAALILEKVVKGLGQSGGHDIMAGAIIEDVHFLDEKQLYNSFVEKLNL